MYNDRDTHQVYLHALAEVSKIGTIPAGYLNAKISIHNRAKNEFFIYKNSMDAQ